MTTDSDPAADIETVAVQPRPDFDAKAFCEPVKSNYRYAKEADCDRLIDRDCLLVDAETGQRVGLYLAGGAPVDDIRPVLQSISYNQANRQQGLQGGLTRTFGYLPRSVRTQNWCRASSLTRDHPQKAARLMRPSAWAATQYKRYLPARYSYHMSTVREEVLDSYAIADTPFTSGIANKNYRLAYHFDAGNFEDTCSAMVCVRQHCEGGRLCLPRYNIKLAIGDRSLLVFNGQSTVHGVTPLRRLRADAYRYSVVYYSLKQLWNCLPPGEELTRAREDRTMREQKRADGRAGEPSDG